MYLVRQHTPCQPSGKRKLIIEILYNRDEHMLQRHFEIEQIAPWIISGASGCYIVARARRLSRARSSRSAWPHFLADQADVILALCGCPAAWHIARHRAAARRPAHSDTGDHQ